MWIVPAAVVLLSLLEYAIFILYNKNGHPWKIILAAALEVGNIILIKCLPQIRVASHRIRGFGVNLIVNYLVNCACQ